MTSTPPKTSEDAAPDDDGQNKGEEAAEAEPLNEEGLKDRKQAVSFQRELSLLHALSYVVGTIIGSGIFISPKGVLREAEAVGPTLLIWTACGLMAMAGALSYAELALTIPKAGGQYTYMRDMYGDVVAFFLLWTKMLIQGPIVRAIQAMTFATYFVQAAYGEESCDEERVAEKLIACVILILLVYINCRGTRLGAWFQVFSTAGKIIALILIIIIGSVYVTRGEVSSFADPFVGSSTDIGSIALAFYPGLYAYSGYTAIVYGLTELKRPERNLPVAITGGLILIILLYLLTNIAYFAVLTPAEMLKVDAVALTFGAHSLGVFYWVFSVFVCISVTGTLNSAIFASCRLYHSAAKQGQMLPVLAMMSVERKTPVPAHIFGAILTLIYLIMGEIYTLINTLGFVVSFENLLLISGLIYWRVRRPDIPRPVKYPIIVHVSFALITLFLLALPLYHKYEQFGVGFTIMSTSLIVYYLFLYKKNARRIPQCLHQLNHRLTDLVQKIFYCVYEEDYVEVIEEPRVSCDDDEGDVVRPAGGERYTQLTERGDNTTN